MDKSGVEEIILPNTLKDMCENAFKGCERLEIVWVEEGCAVNVKNNVNCSVMVLSLNAMVGKQSLRNLRRQKDVVIPEGTECIGEKWFVKSEVESVIIPASVAAIGNEAFRDCKSLKRVTFAGDSKLKKIGYNCFSGSGLKELVLPPSVREVSAGTFKNCKQLKRV